MTTKQVGEFSVTAVSDGVLYSNHDVILLDKAESERLTGIPYGQPVPLDVNAFLIRHGGKLILSDAGSGHTMGPTLGKLPANLRAIGVAPETIDLIMLTHLHPDSRGEILLRSADPHDPPRIRYNFFTAPNDLPTLRQGFKIARELAAQPPLARFRGAEMSPGPKVKTDAEIDNWIRNVAATANHPASTCVMGTGPDTVVDPQFRVHGTEQLRVVDASAMPDLVSAHINACVQMMAEKAADHIRGKTALERAA